MHGSRDGNVCQSVCRFGPDFHHDPTRMNPSEPGDPLTFPLLVTMRSEFGQYLGLRQT